MASWHDTESVRKFWKDAPADEDVLNAYLTAARDAVLAYAPTLPGEQYTYEDGYIVPTEIPDVWALAQAMQARNIWNAIKAAPGGDMDGSNYGITAYPLDWAVKQLLRPQRGMGAIA